MRPEEATAEFVARCDRIWTSTRRGALVVTCLLACVGALLIARVGTDRFRVASAFLMILWAVLPALILRHFRRGDPHARLVRIAGRRASREVNALDRVMRTEKRAPTYLESAELAALAVARAMMRIPASELLVREGRLARRVRLASIACFVVTSFVVVAMFIRLVEGADVLLSRHGLAPVKLPYVSELEVHARPPAYLHEPEKTVSVDGLSRHPKGTVLTVRASLLTTPRVFVLSDGEKEVPLIDDGQGGFVAHWTLTAPARLRVRARFGDVAIEDFTALALGVIDDEPPKVQLEGAPLQLSLADRNLPPSIALRYQASDDHGLRDVELVMRAGSREVRRSLSHFDLDTRTDSGARTLRLSETMIAEATSPVEVHIEARDNDTVSGPKWGRSEAIVLVPPRVGESESLRQAALRKARDAAIDLLATLLSKPTKSNADVDVKGWNEKWRKQSRDLRQLALEALAFDRPNVRLKARLASRISKLLEKVRLEASKFETKTDLRPLRTVVEDFALMVDRIAMGLDVASAKSSSKKLAVSADELVNAFAAMQRVSAEGVIMSSALTVLSDGTPYMLTFGPLGRELGQVIKGDLARVGRARAERKWRVAELSSRDLAARLHNADFAMQSSGGGGQGGGAGDSADPGGDRGGGDDLDRAFNDAANEIQRTARDQKQLADENSDDGDPLAGDDTAKSELLKHAQSVRQAAKPLPSVGQGSDSWTSKGASGKEQAERAARALEQGKIADAVEALRTAESELDEARRMARKSPWSRDGEGEAAEAKRKLGEERTAIETMQRELQTRGKGGSPEKLREQTKKQDELTKRVGRMRGLGDDLPDDAKDSLDRAHRHAEDATQSLRKADRGKALEKQRSAQRELERAVEQLSEKGEGGKGEDGLKASDLDADVPGSDKHKGPDELRERIQRGLGRPAGPRIREAVRRYSEGLLR